MKNRYNDYADEYATAIASRDEWGFSPYLDLVVPALLGVLGHIRGRSVLDACCGEGSFTRLLAGGGAHVIGIDISARLIEMARQKETEERRGISYAVSDLTRPLLQYAAHFDLITCNLALDDVADYRALIKNLADMLKPGGRLALSMNNPYSAVIRKRVQHYFDSGRSSAHVGLAAAGVLTLYYHRTLEEYFREFTANGLFLRTWLDLKPGPEHLASGSPRPRRYYHFPFFLVLELVKV